MVNEDVTSPISTQRTSPIDAPTDGAGSESATIRIAPSQRNLEEEAERMAEAQAQESKALQFDADQVVFELDALSCFMTRSRRADISLQVPRNKITALIGPSGCGKSTLLRSFNRMNDLIDGARIEGSVRYTASTVRDGVDRSRSGAASAWSSRTGSVPKSISTTSPSARSAGYRGRMDELVERSRSEPHLGRGQGKLKQPARPCPAGSSSGSASLARRVEPDVILMDEPCSALDRSRR